MPVERLANDEYKVCRLLLAKNWLFVALQRLGTAIKFLGKAFVHEHRLIQIPNGITLNWLMHHANAIIVGHGIAAKEEGMTNEQHHSCNF